MSLSRSTDLSTKTLASPGLRASGDTAPILPPTRRGCAKKRFCNDPTPYGFSRVWALCNGIVVSILLATPLFNANQLRIRIDRRPASGSGSPTPQVAGTGSYPLEWISNCPGANSKDGTTPGGMAEAESTAWYAQSRRCAVSG